MPRTCTTATSWRRTSTISWPRPRPPTKGTLQAMFLTTLAIRRPLIVLIGLGALIAFGLLALTRLGVELFPTIDYPAVTIATPYPGAGPDAVDTLVTQKLEAAVSTANEIDYI